MKKYLAWILPGILVLALDQWAKSCTEDSYQILIPGVLALHGAKNTGAAMGLFLGKPFLVLIISLLLAGAAVFLLRSMHPKGLAALSLSLIAGGALGNMLDRVILGYVRDMFEVLFMDFYIFNVADAGIVCGAILCAFSLLFRPQDWSKA